jgi:hypothetical protein
MKEVLEAEEVGIARDRDGVGENLRLPVDVFRSSSRQTRSESSAVVMPQVASCPS